MLLHLLFCYQILASSIPEVEKSDHSFVQETEFISLNGGPRNAKHIHFLIQHPSLCDDESLASSGQEQALAQLGASLLPSRRATFCQMGTPHSGYDPR